RFLGLVPFSSSFLHPPPLFLPPINQRYTQKQTFSLFQFQSAKIQLFSHVGIFFEKNFIEGG
ncbi:MAG: hypothetical protein IJ745_06460, partial [Bacteroidales bacterium]|nr:hypothetical protein [Bacteroidales bacterium]